VQQAAVASEREQGVGRFSVQDLLQVQDVDSCGRQGLAGMLHGFGGGPVGAPGVQAEASSRGLAVAVGRGGVL
jgi:hypothetical protein